MLSKKDFKEYSNKVVVVDYLDYRTYLSAVYQEIKTVFKRYSYLLYSDSLGLGHCNASFLIINNRRNLTEKSAQKIAACLGLVKDERRYFISLVLYQHAKDDGDREKHLKNILSIKSKRLDSNLDKQQLQFFEKWYHAAILELLHLENSKDSPEWIAQQLAIKVTPRKVADSLNLMESLGYLKRNESGNLKPTEKDISTGAEVFGVALVSFHEQMLGVSEQAMTSVPAKNRDFSALTMSVSEETANLMKQEVIQFRKKMIELSHRDQSKNQVVQLNMQLFKLLDDPLKKEEP